MRLTCRQKRGSGLKDRTKVKKKKNYRSVTTAQDVGKAVTRTGNEGTREYTGVGRGLGAKEWMNVCPTKRKLLLVRRQDYITSSDCMRRGGVRNEETFWKRSRSLEGAWKELKRRAGAQGRSSTLATGQAPWLDLKVGARLRARRKPSCPPFDGRRDDKRRCGAAVDDERTM
jgi:hypothetical protein